MKYLYHQFDVDVVINTNLSDETQKGYREMVPITTYEDGFRDELFVYADGTKVYCYRDSVSIMRPDSRVERFGVRSA